MTRLGNARLNVVVLGLALFGIARSAEANWWMEHTPPEIVIGDPTPGPCPEASIPITVTDLDEWGNTGNVVPPPYNLRHYNVTLSGAGLAKPIVFGDPENPDDNGPTAVQIPKEAHGTLQVTVRLENDSDSPYTPESCDPNTRYFEVKCSCDVTHGGATSGGGGGGSGCGSCGGGTKDAGPGSGGPAMHSAYLSLSLGRAKNGDSAGFITMEADMPSTSLATPSMLHYDVTRDDVEVYRDPTTQNLRQILAQECFVDIATDSQNQHKYYVKFYTPTGISGPTGGPWTLVNPTLLLSWVIENPDQSGATYNNLRVTRRAYDDSVVRQYDFAGTNGSRNWTLTISDNGTNVGRVESESWETVTLDSAPADLCHFRIYEAGGQTLVYSVDEYYREFDWGRELVKEVVAPNTSNARETVWHYSTSGNGIGRRDYETHPNGSWVQYSYDSQGRVSQRLESWRDVARTSATTGNARAIGYLYAGVDQYDNVSVCASEPRTVTETIEGTTVALTYYAYYQSPINSNNNTVLEHRDDLVKIEERCASGGASYGQSGNLRTKTVYVGLDTTRPRSVQYADGRVDVYAYEMGDYIFDVNGNVPPWNPTFTPSSSGVYERISVSHEYLSNGVSTPVAQKSTQDSTVRNALYYTVLTEAHVHNGTDYSARVGWAAFSYDSLGHVTHTYHSNGTQSSDSWSCCAHTATTDEQGVTTGFTPDVLGRVHLAVRDAVASYNGYAGQAERTTTSLYNAFGSVTSVSVSGGGVSSTRTRAYDDLTQRVTGETIVVASGDLTTTYTYGKTSAGGDTVTVTRPGGATEITEYYCDGRIKCVHGTGMISRAYHYEVLTSTYPGHLVIKTLMGTPDPDATNRARWSSTRTDLFGRTAEEQRPPYSGSTMLSATYVYASDTGRLTRVERNDGANTIYEYDYLGHVVKTVVDANHNESIDPSGPDRITETERTYVYLSPDWWLSEVTNVSSEETGSTLHQVSKTDTRLTGLGGSNPIAEVNRWGWDVNHATNVKTALDVTHHVLTETTDLPECSSTNDAQRAWLGGLLVQEQNSGGIVTNYTYDGLGRRNGVGDGRGKWTMTTFDAADRPTVMKTGASSSTAGDGLTTTYSYYDSATNDGFNYGRLKCVEEPLVGSTPKRTYYAYDDHGQTIEVWGSGAYAVFYTYEGDYHERTKMTTFRTYDFTGSTWPSGADATSGDTTVWEYQAATGLVIHKTYANGSSSVVSYDYTPAGRLASRTWARILSGSTHVTTTYEYADGDHAGETYTGELLKVTYNDNVTHEVDYGYTRLGQLQTVSDAAGTRTLAYDNTASMAPTTETYGSGGNELFSGLIVTQKYEGSSSGVPGRYIGVKVGTSGSSAQYYEATYGYGGGTGRLSSVQGPGLPSSGVTYTYADYTDFAYRTDVVDGSTIKLREDRTLDDTRPIVSEVKNTWRPVDNPNVTSRYVYSLDDRSQRNGVTISSDGFSGFTWSWGYDDRGELTSADRNNNDADDRAYAYDPIGNRTGSHAGTSGNPWMRCCVNNLNQYTYLYQGSTQECPPDISWGQPAYDADGDLTNDGGANHPSTYSGTPYTFVYDGENRLVEARPTTLTTSCTKVTYTYDYRNRRVQRQTWTCTNTSGNGTWSLASTTRYVWDGWLPLAEFDGSGNLLRSYTWGLDLAGQWAGGLGATGARSALEAAGGIGGLLAVREGNASSTTTYAFTFDGNGNVSEVVDLSVGTWNASNVMVATYQYDPYGNVIGTPGGAYAATNRWRFSTKQFDSETNLGYWGYRWYSAWLSRWTNRDPSGEQGDENLYAFVDNDPIREADPFGLQTTGGGLCKCCCCVENLKISNIRDDPTAGWYGHDFDVVVDTQWVYSHETVDCKLEWREWSTITIPGHPPRQWHDMFAEYSSSPTFDGWTKNRKKVCGLPETATITDTPSGNLRPGSSGVQDLYFEIRVSSAPGCPCSQSSKVVQAYQHWEIRNGAPVTKDFTPYWPPKQKLPFR